MERLVVIKRLVIAALVAAGLPAMETVRADELVSFDSMASRRFQTPFSRAHGEVVPITPAVTIQGYLSRPAGAGPFPAVIVLHPCTGLSAAQRATAETLASWGYVALAIDDFTTRGISHSCKNSAFRETMEDALGGLFYVAKLPYVDVRRIAVVGFSQGGGTALAVAMDRLPPLVDALKPPVPRAVVSFYPPCFDIRGRLVVPTLVLVGERDNWSVPAYCDELKNRVSDNVEFKLVAFPGAHHAFDDPAAGAGRNVFGHWLQHDAAAAAQALSEMRAFLAKHLAN